MGLVISFDRFINNTILGAEVLRDVHSSDTQIPIPGCSDSRYFLAPHFCLVNVDRTGMASLISNCFRSNC